MFGGWVFGHRWNDVLVSVPVRHGSEFEAHLESVGIERFSVVSVVDGVRVYGVRFTDGQRGVLEGVLERMGRSWLVG